MTKEAKKAAKPEKKLKILLLSSRWIHGETTQHLISRYMYYRENKSVDTVHVIVLLMCVLVGTFPGTQ